MPWCPVRAIDIRPHIAGEHLADCFVGGEGPELATIQLAALQAQAFQLVGSQDPHALLSYLNERGLVPRGEVRDVMATSQMEML